MLIVYSNVNYRLSLTHIHSITVLNMHVNCSASIGGTYIIKKCLRKRRLTFLCGDIAPIRLMSYIYLNSFDTRSYHPPESHNYLNNSIGGCAP
jgi:hypothetical protein